MRSFEGVFRKAAVILAALFGLAFLAWFSFHLASIRILQVDECGNVFAARYLAEHQAAKLGGSFDLFQYVLSLLSHGATRSMDLFINARFLMLEIFWLNISLIVVATGERLFSLRGLLAFCGAATLTPVWDYGFEARHDNLVLSMVLLSWALARSSTSLGLQSYVIMGALAVSAQFTASKSFVYTLPIATLLLVFPPPGTRAPRWKLVLAWGVGGLLSFCALYFLYRSAGLWNGYLAGGQSMSALAMGNNRFAPWNTLERLLTQTPLLLAALVVPLTSVISAIVRQAPSAFSWLGCLPEAGLFSVALVALFVNPTPYPYNLLHLVPYAFLFVWRYYASLLKTAAVAQPILATVLPVVVFTHLVPFAIATHRHTGWLNYRQERVIRLAEDLTDPVKDPVYDAIGMVVTRPFVDRRAFLHGLLINNFLKRSGLRLRDMLATNPPAVVIPSYRTDWLPEEDHAFIRERYVSVADDFLVLGKILPAGGGTFEVFHGGRYRISTLKGSDLDGTYPLGLKGLETPEDPGAITGTIDGQPLSAHPVELGVGLHHLECPSDCQPAVVWMGPHLERIHRLGPGDHGVLFYNWY